MKLRFKNIFITIIIILDILFLYQYFYLKYLKGIFLSSQPIDTTNSIVYDDKYNIFLNNGFTYLEQLPNHFIPID